MNTPTFEEKLYDTNQLDSLLARCASMDEEELEFEIELYQKAAVNATNEEDRERFLFMVDICNATLIGKADNSFDGYPV